MLDRYCRNEVHKVYKTYIAQDSVCNTNYNGTGATMSVQSAFGGRKAPDAYFLIPMRRWFAPLKPDIKCPSMDAF